MRKHFYFVFNESYVTRFQRAIDEANEIFNRQNEENRANFVIFTGLEGARLIEEGLQEQTEVSENEE